MYHSSNTFPYLPTEEAIILTFGTIIYLRFFIIWPLMNTPLEQYKLFELCINGTMLMASFSDLLLLLHITFVIFIHLLTSYFRHFHPCVESYYLNIHEYTMVEFNLLLVLNIWFISLFQLLQCCYEYSCTCFLRNMFNSFPDTVTSFGSGIKKIYILRWVLSKEPFVWEGCGETSKDRAAPQG